MTMPLVRQISKNLDIYFGECTINENEDSFEIVKDGKCAEFFVESERTLGIKSINRCGFSGTSILERIELLGMHVKINSIYLDDQSSVNFGDVKLNFGVLNIIVKGNSWYNSLGYFQDNYQYEKSIWDTVRKFTLGKLFEYMTYVSYSEYKTKNKGWYTDGLSFFGEENGVGVNEYSYYELIKEFIYYLESVFGTETELLVLMLELFIISKSDGNIDDKTRIDYFYLLSAISYIVPYTRFPLIKKLI